MDSFVLCTRNSIPGEDSFGESSGKVSYLQIPDEATTPLPEHTVVGGVRAWMRTILAQIGAQADPATGNGGPAVVFFVHGYNTNATEALLRQRLVQRRLHERGLDCLVIGFDWPTAGNVAAYLYDRLEAQKAAANLVAGGIIPFMDFSVDDCPVAIHLMAHSMGAFVVREAFRVVDKARVASLANDWRIGQLVLFAADISSDCFTLGNSDMVPVFNHCGRLTNYFSGHDRALAVSNAKNIDISSRVGRVGMPSDTPAHEKAVDVDCSARYAAIPERTFAEIHGMTSHSWYLEDAVWLDDLCYTLQGQIDRNLIPSRTRIAANDFVLNAQQPD